MSNLDNVNGAFSAAVYKKLQKQISPLVEKLTQLEEDTRLIETTPGPKGNKGIKGDKGITGRSGERGLIGEQGPQGIQGKNGSEGTRGNIGPQGIQGDQGIQGETGEQGIQGETGEQGIQGDVGEKGDTGQQGLKGEAGQQGIQGISGNPGKDGQTGPQGIQGIQGESGINGENGKHGETGEAGPQGIQGEAGPQGETGLKGEDGKDAELPDLDKIIEPHFVKAKVELDSYVTKSNKDFTNWKSVINNQISNNSGGGAVKISQLVDVQQSTAKVDGNFLKYDASQKKWVGVDIVAGAPGQLDTLNELAEALNDDQNFAASVTSSIAAKASQTDLDTHTGNTNNPHSVTATQVGLGSVEDKSSATIRSEIVDGDIPSTIARDSELSAHTDLTNNPHSVTKAHVGLGNVEDKSAATIIGEIVDSDIPSTIARDSELPTKSSLGLSNVTDESKATMFTNPVFTGTISSSGSINFGDRSSNDTLINVESDSGDLTLFRAASFADGVGINIKYIGSGAEDENIFEIATDGGGSFKMDQSGDVGINTAPIDGVGLSTTSAHIVGNVGIGVTAPTAKLHVKNTSSGNVLRQLRLHNDSTTAGTGAGIAFTNSSSETFVSASIDSVRATSTANGNLVFSTRADATAGDDNAVIERMRIDENGNVGIGTTSPSGALDVSGNIKSNTTFILDVPDSGGAPATTAIIDINGYEGRGAGIKIQDSKNSAAAASNREWFIGSGYAQSGFNIGYASDGNQSSYAAQNKLTIDTSGNVGIGTTSPSEKLHISGSTNGHVKALIQNTSVGSNAYATLGFQNSLPHAVNPGLFLNGVNASVYAGANSLNMYQYGSYNLGFVTNNELRMMVQGGGNVGIGETSPSVKLHVNAGATNSIAIFQSSDDKAVIQIKDNDTNVHLIAKDNKLALGNSTTDTDKFNVDITNGDVISAGVVNAKGVSLNANTFTVVSTTSTLAAATNGLTVILQNTAPITITLPTLAAGHVTTFISETIHGVTFVGDTGIAINSFNGMNTTAGIFAQCQVIYKTTAIAFLGGNLV